MNQRRCHQKKRIEKANKKSQKVYKYALNKLILLYTLIVKRKIV